MGTERQRSKLLWMWFVLLVVNFTSLAHNTPQKGHAFRLSGGDLNGMGQLQVNIMGEWWFICKEGVDLTTAQLVCQQLGFKYALSVQAKNTSESQKQGPFGSIKCEGMERQLGECKQDYDKKYKCPSDSLAEVTCGDATATALPDYQVRLVGGTFPYEGRVEISYNGQWGTVCDDGWGSVDADVVCQQLGYYAAEAVASTAYYGKGDGPILLDDLTCIGNETSIVYCSHSGIGQHNCDHSEDAGVRCHENRTNFATMSPGTEDSILPFIVVLINGLIALLILVGCVIYCYLKIWDRYTGHTRRAQLRRSQNASMQGGTQTNEIPMEYTEEPPLYHTVQQNRDVYITQRPETPPPEYSEAMKLQAGISV